MLEATLHGLISFVELTSLSTLVGVVLCLVWTAHRKDGDIAAPTFAANLGRLLIFCLIALTVSSIVDPIQRTMEMSGRGIREALPLLPTVLLKTHYGKIGFVRAAGLGLALVTWFVGNRHMRSRGFAVFMLCAASAIAFSRSATSHAADSGDLSLPELSDWFHLMAACSWGGALLAIAVMASPSRAADNIQVQGSIAGIADRFYSFFGPVFAVLTASGLYNAWVEVRAFEPLWTTTYGRILSVKLVLFALLTVRYIAPPQHGNDDAAFAMKFLRRIRLEAALVLAILLSVALFTHEIPGRHAVHMMQGHGHDMAPGDSMGSGHDMEQHRGMEMEPGHIMEHGHSMDKTP